MAARGLILLLSRRWGWVGLGALVLVIGGGIFFTAQPTQPVEIDGTIAHYREYTTNGSYDHNELILNQSSTSYTLDKNQFQPTLPDQFYGDGKVSIWVDQGTTTIVAIKLYDNQDQNPIMYTSDAYDHPSDAVTSSHAAGGVIGGIGAILLLVGLAWPLLPFGRKKAPVRQPAPVAAGPAPSAYGQPGAYGQQPGYAPPSPMPGAYGQQPGQQPGYGASGQPPAQPGWGQPPSPYGQPDAGSSQGNWGEPPLR
jgi:hypothetical protein